LNAATISELKAQYNGLKIEYLKAVLNGNPDREIKQLEQLIAVGNKIGENTSKYKSELARLQKSQEQKALKEQARIDAQPPMEESSTPTTESVANTVSASPVVEEAVAPVVQNSFGMQVETVQPAVTKDELYSQPKTKSSKYSIDSITNDENTITVHLNKPITQNEIKVFELNDGKNHRTVFDISGTFGQASQTKLQMDEIQRISVGQFKPDVVRITLANSSTLETAYTIEKDKIIIKILNITPKQKMEQSKKETTRELIKQPITTIKPLIPPSVNEVEEKTPQLHEPISSKVVINPHKGKRKTVVIDPGHGGKDSGAVGVGNKYEKTVVFDVSKYLYDILKSRGYEVYLTRKDDTFIELKHRTKLSNDKHADIFVSIHTNAIGKEKANTAEGIETFFLSPARSERAKRVAALENESDMDAMNNNSQMTFLTVLNQSKITASNKLAIDIQQNLLYSARKSYSDIVDGGVREGPFWVLVGAQMPSVLVELGYISHQKESKRLYTTNYQKQLAIGLANGIDAYFSKNDY
jgi:N-acetylmuramoyl-L-alanine amidase